MDISIFTDAYPVYILCAQKVTPISVFKLGLPQIISLLIFFTETKEMMIYRPALFVLNFAGITFPLYNV